MRRAAGRQLTQADTSARRRFLCNSFKQTSLSAGKTLGQSHPDVSYAMSAWGQTEKNSVRAYVFRFALKLGHFSMHSACLKGAIGGPLRCAEISFLWLTVR